MKIPKLISLNLEHPKNCLRQSNNLNLLITKNHRQFLQQFNLQLGFSQIIKTRGRYYLTAKDRAVNQKLIKVKYQLRKLIKMMIKLKNNN